MVSISSIYTEINIEKKLFLKSIIFSHYNNPWHLILFDEKDT
ncbi:hypothetical protein JN11_03905 [Mucilaginibacter frigoritolerans]|uniref:Uncharacterized protein n=1 Tax=Mucilaginibacter frigoritolerans TaxID=652788 RepID=A0A562TTI3_9SPHI|nr:hypothetical protein JN11_03905 [Mucilaginibacter frigoritolerans]